MAKEIKEIISLDCGEQLKVNQKIFKNLINYNIRIDLEDDINEINRNKEIILSEEIVNKWKKLS